MSSLLYCEDCERNVEDCGPTAYLATAVGELELCDECASWRINDGSATIERKSR
jgi:hypothetical protein